MVLDSDEGIRIENSNNMKKIFINRNLFGTYSILIRSFRKIDQTTQERRIDKNIKNEEYTEAIFNYNEINHVLKFIEDNMDKFDVWAY